MACDICRRLEGELASVERLREKALARVNESMSGPYETYLALRNAENAVNRDLLSARRRLADHQLTHRPAA